MIFNEGSWKRKAHMFISCSAYADEADVEAGQSNHRYEHKQSYHHQNKSYIHTHMATVKENDCKIDDIS